MKYLLIFSLVLFIGCSSDGDEPVPDLPDVVYYRLMEVDLDGNQQFFDPIRVDVDKEGYAEIFNITKNEAALSQETARTNEDWWLDEEGWLVEYCNLWPSLCREFMIDYEAFCPTQLNLCRLICEDYGHLEPCQIIPIRLLSFTGYSSGGFVNLTYETAAEINSSHVIIQVTENPESVGWTDIHARDSECPTGCRYHFIDDFRWYTGVILN